VRLHATPFGIRAIAAAAFAMVWRSHTSHLLSPVTDVEVRRSERFPCHGAPEAWSGRAFQESSPHGGEARSANPNSLTVESNNRPRDLIHWPPARRATSPDVTCMWTSSQAQDQSWSEPLCRAAAQTLLFAFPQSIDRVPFLFHVSWIHWPACRHQCARETVIIIQVRCFESTVENPFRAVFIVLLLLFLSESTAL